MLGRDRSLEKKVMRIGATDRMSYRHAQDAAFICLERREEAEREREETIREVVYTC